MAGSKSWVVQPAGSSTTHRLSGLHPHQNAGQMGQASQSRLAGLWDQPARWEGTARHLESHSSKAPNPSAR